MFVSCAKTAAVIGAAALLVGNPLVGAASAAPPPPGDGTLHNTVVDIGHTHEGFLTVSNPSTQIVYVNSVDEGMATATESAYPGGITAITAAGLDALLLNGRAADIAALPGTKMVGTYQDPSARGGILSQLHLVQSAPAGPDVIKFQLVREYSLLDDAPSVVGLGMIVAIPNSIATMLMTSQQDYRDGWNGGLPYQAFYNDPENPDNGFTAVLIAPDLALTVLIRSVPVVGPPLATITEPLLRHLVNSSYPEDRRDDGSLMTEYAPNPGLKLPSLNSQIDLLKQLPGDLQQGWNNYQTQQHPPAAPPVPDPAARSNPEPEAESFAPATSGSGATSRPTQEVSNEPPAESDDVKPPKTNVVRNSLAAKPGQQFANDVNNAVQQANGNLQRTVHQVQTGLQQAGQNLQGAIRDTVNNLTKPHKPSTGNGDSGNSGGDSGSSGSSSSGSSGSDSGGGDK